MIIFVTYHYHYIFVFSISYIWSLLLSSLFLSFSLLLLLSSLTVIYYHFQFLNFVLSFIWYCCCLFFTITFIFGIITLSDVIINFNSLIFYFHVYDTVVYSFSLLRSVTCFYVAIAQQRDRLLSSKLGDVGDKGEDDVLILIPLGRQKDFLKIYEFCCKWEATRLFHR